MTYAPNSELVAVAWLGGITGLTSAMVSMTLPSDTSTWSATGFVTVGSGDIGSSGIIGGTPDPYTRLRNPVASVHTWAVKPGSAKPPWRMAANLAELIVAGCYDEDNMRRVLVLPTGYGCARVMEATVLREPSRVPGDQGGYARFYLDLQLHWVSLG